MMNSFLDGRRILVLEDEYLVALDVQQLVEECGGTVVGPVGRLDQAQELVRTQAIEGAILDVRLDGTTSFPLARLLRQQGTAVVFLTGYEAASIDPEFRDFPRLSKPFDARGGENILRSVFA